MFTNNLSLSSLDVNLKWTDLQQLLVKEGIDLPTRLNSSSTAIATIVLVICLILGCLLIFRGERLFRLWMVLCGALVGSICGRFIARLINPSSPSLIIIGIFTLIGIGLFATLMRGFIVTAGFATGALFAWTFVHPGTPQILGVSSVLVCGLAGGILYPLPMSGLFAELQHQLAAGWSLMSYVLFCFSAPGLGAS